jgi:hypothetical protein
MVSVGELDEATDVDLMRRDVEQLVRFDRRTAAKESVLLRATSATGWVSSAGRTSQPRHFAANHLGRPHISRTLRSEPAWRRFRIR